MHECSKNHHISYRGASLIGSSLLIIEVNHVKSIFEELEWEGKLVTPFCSINFGDGKFLISLVFLEYDKQPEDIREKIILLLSEVNITDV